MRNLLTIALAGLAGLAGCATARTFELPMTAPDLVSDGASDALVAYLGQPGADPSVCDLAVAGPHLAAIPDDAGRALASGLADGRIAPAAWRACTDAMLGHLDGDRAAAFLDPMAKAYRALLVDPRLDHDPRVGARLAALQSFYAERDAALHAHQPLTTKLVASLRTALDKDRLGATGQRFGRALLEAMAVEHGSFRGATVDALALDRLQAAGDDASLRLLSARLPEPSLRLDARRRVVRLAIARSPFPEVRADAATVEERVMKQGANPVSTAAHPPRDAAIHAPGPPRGVLVRQQPLAQRVTLLSWSDEPPSVIEPLALRESLQVDLEGISRPVTVCAPPSALDPSPCLSPGELTVQSPLAWRDGAGAVHLVEQLSSHDAVRMARAGERLRLPVAIAGKALTAIDWDLAFARPDDLVLQGAAGGGDGPRLEVKVDARDPRRWIYRIDAGGERYRAVIEREDVVKFHVVSKGGTGAPGEFGGNGMDGSDGSAASSCGGNGGSGGNGGPGGDGGSGGPGGRGGDVALTAVCSGAACGEVAAVLRGTVLSLGGDGGPGGSGGAGGRGGSGGAGASGCESTDSDGNATAGPSGSSGSSGSDGSSGANGPSGPPGAPGAVTLRIAPPPPNRS